ncbi:MAG: folate family ECF transporter S component [Lactovum sp.]
MKKFKIELNLQKLVYLAMLIALGIVLSLYTIGTNIWQINFTFIVNTLLGIIAGPFLSGISLAVQDIIYSFLFSAYGYNWQFTFSAVIVGFVYGLLFYKKRLDISRKNDWIYTLFAVTFIMLLDSLFFNSLWVSITYKMPFEFILKSRLPLLIQIVPRTVITMLIFSSLDRIPIIKKALHL